MCYRGVSTRRFLYVQCERDTSTAKVERARIRHLDVDTAQRSTAQRNTNKKFAVWDIALGAFVFLELRNGMGWVDGGWAMGFNGAKMGILLILCLFIYLVFWESVGGIGYGSGFWERDGGRVGLWCF